MDPFERQTGDVARQYEEHKTWVLTPMLGIAEQHLASFKEFPIRQVGLSAQVGKTIEGIQDQILKLKQTKQSTLTGHRDCERIRKWNTEHLFPSRCPSGA